MVSLGEVCQLEVDCERLGHLIRAVDRHVSNEFPHPLYQIIFAELAPRLVFLGLHLAMFDDELSKFFNRVVEIESGLFFEDFTEQPPQGAHIAAQRDFFEVSFACQLTKPGCLIIGFPERVSRHFLFQAAPSHCHTR